MKRWQLVALIVGISLGANLAFSFYEHKSAEGNCKNITLTAQNT